MVSDEENKIELSGRINSENAAEVEKNILQKITELKGKSFYFDAEKLEYISSAGLRSLLRILKQHEKIRIANVSTSIYEILETTGFTSLFDVEKSYRRISVEGCPEIGRGASGKIYSIDQDNVVKVYNNSNALEEIKREREKAKLALILGIPTAISYEIVRVGDSYGSVFELLSPVSFSHIIASEPGKIGWCVEESVRLLKQIHSTHVPEGKLPDARQRALSWAAKAKEVLDDSDYDRICELISSVPYEDRMLHGDYHSKNIMLHNGEVLIIDMESMRVGHPVFELAAMFDAYVGFSEADSEQVMRFQGFDRKTSIDFWERSLEAYLGTGDPAVLKSVTDKARVVGYVRMLQYAKDKNRDFRDREKCIDIWKKHLREVLDTVDTLVFDA